MGTHPPGWYDDQRTPGFQRWWDGQQWTVHVQPLEPALQPFDGRASPEPAPGSSRWWQRKRFIIPTGVVAGLIVAAAVTADPAPDDEIATLPLAADSAAETDEAPAEAATTDTVGSSSTTAAPAASVPAPPPTNSATTTSTTGATTTRPTTASTTAPTTAAPTTAAPTTTLTTAAPTTTTAAPTTASACDPNYSGCVPIASDVDCAGGSGNGPAYVQGPVNVIGIDIYDLDRDGDGIGCE